MRAIDTVEISVVALRHLCDLVESAIVDVDDAYAHMARVRVEDPSVMDEVVDARAALLCAGDHVARLHALSAYIPGEES